MNKLFNKIAVGIVSIAMAIGVGVAVSSNRDVTSVSATVGSDVTIGSGTYTSAYETGFENCTAGTEYNKTQTYTSSAANGAAWSVYYGTVSTNDAINDSKSMQMRWYKTASTTYGHAETTSAKTNVAAFKFSYKVSNKNLKFDVYYGTNGSAWTKIETVTASNTSAGTYSHEFDETVASFYMKVQVSSSGTAPSSGNYKFIIDNVVFGSPKAVACTVTLNKNGGSGGTDSVSATKGSAMPTLASAPTRTGYTFAGYYDDASAGTQYYTANRASARNWDKDGTTATLYAHWTANQYNINYYDQGGGTFSGSHESGYPTKHTYGTETTLKGATKGGHNFDGWFTTSACTGSAVTSLGATSYTAAISLYAKWTATGTTYSITTTVTNGTYSGDTSITDNGGVASVTIAPTGDYKLPASVSVSGADHTYNDSTGVISLSNATGDVTISAAMVALTEYSIAVNETNGSHTGASTIKESRTASLTFEPDPGYGQPASVTVTGATYTWTRGTGVLSLSNPTGNVSITYVAAENELTSITLGTKKTAYILGEDFSMPVVTAHYSITADKVVTGSATESGYDPYSIGNKSITISYTEGGITKTSSYSVTVSAKSVQTITTWEATTLSQLTADDVFVIVGNNGSNYAMTNDNGTTSAPGVAAVTVSNNKLSAAPAANLQWNISGNATDGYTFYPNGSTTTWLYCTATNNGVRVGTNANKTFTISDGGYLVNAGTSRYVGIYSSQDWRCYTSINSNIENQTFSYFKKVETQVGTASLIRIVCDPAIDPETGYKGGDKFVGDKIYTTDFVVKKQLDTGNELTAITGFTINGGTEVELTSTSNTITVGYTEGGIPKTTEVVVPATQRQAELESIQLVEVGTVKKSGYIDFAGASWNLDNINVHYYWSDDDYDTEVTLESLVSAGEASISPVKPTSGATSFTVSYEYLEVQITNNTITLTEAVKSDYVTSMSWGNTTESHFKHFSGEQLTETIVNTWHVKATFAGAGEGERLYWGDYDLYIGNKQITSLPYTWLSEDDGKSLSIHYGKDIDGNEFVKTNSTAKGNICTTINAIDHEETHSGMIAKSATWTTAQSIADYEAHGEDTLCASGFYIDENIHMQGDKADGGTQIRCWSDGIRSYVGNSLIFTPKNGAVITKITLPALGGDCSAAEGDSPWTITTGGGSAITISDLSKATCKNDIVVEYEIEGEVTETTHYANQMEHFDTQKKVVEFAKYLNTTMNGENVCTGSFANLQTAWTSVATKYNQLFGTGTTLNATELAWAKNMLKYATAAWGSEEDNACLEKAMKTYEFCIAQHGLTPFMYEADGTTPLRSVMPVRSFNLLSKNPSAVATVVIISIVSVAAIGGYFFLRKKKEQ